MIGDALRLLRTRQGLTQTAACRREGAPDFRILSHWETRRKLPSVRLLRRYLVSQGLDFHDLQEALDQVEGRAPKRVRDGMESLERRMRMLEERLRLAGAEAVAEPLDEPEEVPEGESEGGPEEEP